MNDNISLNIEGVVKALSPLVISEPRKAHFDPANGRLDWNGGGRRGFFGCSLTARLPVVAGTERIEFPVIKANLLRGRIRRIIADIIERRLIEQGQTLTAKTYSALRSGGTLEKNRNSIDLARFRQVNGHFATGLLGGGSDMFPSRYTTDTAMPVTAFTIAHAGVPEKYRMQAVGETNQPDSVVAWRLLGYAHIVRNDDFADFKDPLAGRVVTNFNEAVDLWQQQLLKQRESDTKRLNGKKGEKRQPEPESEDDSGDTNKIRTIAYHEYVTPGVPFFLRFGSHPVHGLTSAQAGLLLDAIDRLFRAPLGSSVRTGYGRLGASLGVRVNGIEITAQAIGNAMNEPLIPHDAEALPVVTDSLDERLRPIVSDYRQAMEGLRMNDIEAAFQ